VVPGWRNTGAGERHWQGWGIANERSINPATGRPRSDDGYMNEQSRKHREYLAVRRAREAAAEGLMAKLHAAVLRLDDVVIAATWRQLAELGVSKGAIEAAFLNAVREAQARRAGQDLAARRRGAR
jgi:hypothetical protein